MSRVKESLLNGYPEHVQDQIVGIIEEEELFLDRLCDYLERGVADGWIDGDYAEYLMTNPAFAAEWLNDYFGIKV